MPKKHNLHARITDVTHSKLTEKCNEIGCSITDYVVKALDDSFEEEDPATIEPEPIKKKRPEPIPEPLKQVAKTYPNPANPSVNIPIGQIPKTEVRVEGSKWANVSYDNGKTWNFVKDEKI